MNPPRTRTTRHWLQCGNSWRIAVGCIVLVAAACGNDSAAPPAATADTATTLSSTAVDGVTVTINTFRFQPDPLTVAQSTVITFINDDAIDHTVTAGTRDDPQPEVFDRVLPDKGATIELVLDEPGTYEYFCRRHTGPGMTATIVVE